MIGGSKMFEHHKKESPIISLAGVGGGPASYIFYSASGGGTAEISRSLRFNGQDSSNLPKLARNGTAGNQKTWTFSTWLKRTTTGSREQIFSAAGTHNTYIEIQSNKLMIEDYTPGVNFKVQIRRHFIDPGAWYHIVVVVDTTINSPASDRVKIYVNGKRETEFEGTPTYPSENYDTSVNDTGEHKLGQFPGNTNFPLIGYLADVHLVDGTAVTETNGVIDEFGEFDSYNVWQPKAYSRSHGNNGFHLTFSDTSSDAALGTDSAGSNNYTPTNLSANTGGVAEGKTLTRFRTKTDWNWHRISAVKVNGTILTTGTLDNTDSVWSNVNEWKDGNADSSNYTGSTAARGDWFDVTLASNIDNFSEFQLYMQLDSSAGSTTNVYEIELFFSDGTSFLRQYASNSDAPNQSNYQFNSWQWQNFGDLGTVAARNVDVIRDSPSNLTAESGNNIGNYATLNPLRNGQALSNGNLDVVGGSSWQRTTSTMSMSSGKWYWEYEITASNEHIVGVGPFDMQMSGNLGAGSPPGSGYQTETGGVNGTGANGSWSNTGGSTTGDLIGIAFDADAGNMYVYKNGASLNSGAASHTGLTDGPYEAVFSLNGSSRSGSVNFGQRPFKYTPPTNYLPLCSKNLESTTVGVGSSLFDISLWTGDNSASNRVITDTLSFTPDMVWGKQRSQPSRSHQLFDSARGAGSGKDMTPNERYAEGYDSATYGYLNSFDTNGFTVAKGSDSSGGNNYWNADSLDYVGWIWKAGGAPTVDNSANAGQVPTAGSAKVNGANMTTALAGTIQITRLTANTLTGLSIVTFENPSGNNSDTLGHGLGKTPEMIWTKSRDTSGNANPWQVYHKGIGNALKLYLDGTDSTVSTSVWGTTNPTSTVFTLNDSVDDSWIAYVWTSVEGFSSFGSYEGGSGALFVPCGFQPKWVMVKNADRSGEEWIILDASRDPTNVAGHTLYANIPTYEVDYRTGGNARSVSFLSNGFQVHNGNPLLQSGTHIYAAFAEHPLATARAR